ncbi:hypothetical protein GW17_00017756 [Ensete ventricosum]|nr:hypothetical protein GW17_00017756 [Ensete ventricosum]
MRTARKEEYLFRRAIFVGTPSLPAGCGHFFSRARRRNVSPRREKGRGDRLYQHMHWKIRSYEPMIPELRPSDQYPMNLHSKSASNQLRATQEYERMDIKDANIVNEKLRDLPSDIHMLNVEELVKFIYNCLCYLSPTGATVPEYVVTADDVGTFLAVDCTPIDDSGRQVSCLYYIHSCYKSLLFSNSVTFIICYVQNLGMLVYF